MVAVAAVALCLALLWVSMSRESFGFAYSSYILLQLVGLVWLAISVIGLWRYRIWRRSLIAPAVAVLAYSMLWTGMPEKLGWTLSKDALEHAAVTCAPSNGTRLGVYHVSSIAKRDGGCWLYTEDSFMGSSVGFAYFPDSAPRPTSHKTSYRHFDGPWYTFDHDSF
ncbi:hypothetical protein [Nocardia sp. N2S4-5]|uniref:hypothetical protein n=1 Tax=Nocardia sp. N2S4-5 TaxID=3351565 RepID=UPI0037D13134